jgi:PAS domain S-box-containing protein
VAVVCLIGSSALAVLTLVCFRLHVTDAAVVCLYLILVALVSLKGSFVASAVISLLATGCLDYYFSPPIFSFEISDPLDLLTIVAFLTTSAVVTGLATRLQQAMREAYADMENRRRTEEALRRSEAYLADAQKLSHVGSFTWKALAKESTWSDESYRIFELDPTERPTLERILERVHPEDVTEVRQTIERRDREGKDYEHHYRLRMRDGSIKYIHIVAHCQRDADGGIEFVGAVVDETAAKHAEEALRSSEQQWRDVFENNPTMYFMVDAQGTIMAVNRFAAEQLGYTVDEFVGQLVYTVFLDADREAARDRINYCLQQLGRPTTWELRKVRKDGAVRWVRETARAVMRANQPVVLIACEDITERKSAEEKIRQQENEIRQIIDFVPQHVAVLGPDRSRLYINQAALEYHGVTLGEWQNSGRLTPENPSRFFHPDDWYGILSETKEKFSGGLPLALEARLRRKDGTYRWFLFRYNPMRDAQGNIQRWYVAATDIEDLKQAQQKLRQSEAYLAEAQRLSHTGSWAGTRAASQITYWSEECYRVLGFDPHAGLPSFETFCQRVHPEDQARLLKTMEQAAREKATSELDFRIIHPGGAIRDIHVVAHQVLSPTGEPIEAVGTVIDVTERRRAEEERERLREAQAALARVNRVITMGELTAWLAHEVNQPIAAAVTDANTCLRWLTRDHPNLEEARAAARRLVKDGIRAAEIINRIRQHFNNQTSKRELLEINDVIRDTILLMRNEAKRSSISIRTELAENLPLILADRVPLQQVLMNLMINSIDAMKEVSETRELTIVSQPTEGSQVLVSIRDTGVGLPPQLTDQIFNTFVTTKSHGTGLGLRISRSIIESHGGRLWADANSPRGACFSFTLLSNTEAGDDDLR